ncbi:hypothetical protein AMECASPLE_014501 [Ameca splendens]|uniref:Uncharacterized protein n=1 Tax=Ameca splendens TaxID=208324 RepID=A0ABV0ZYW7_9TELE
MAQISRPYCPGHYLCPYTSCSLGLSTLALPCHPGSKPRDEDQDKRGKTNTDLMAACSVMWCDRQVQPHRCGSSKLINGEFISSRNPEGGVRLLTWCTDQKKLDSWTTSLHFLVFQ